MLEDPGLRRAVRPLQQGFKHEICHKTYVKSSHDDIKTSQNISKPYKTLQNRSKSMLTGHNRHLFSKSSRRIATIGRPTKSDKKSSSLSHPMAMLLPCLSSRSTRKKGSAVSQAQFTPKSTWNEAKRGVSSPGLLIVSQQVSHSSAHSARRYAIRP